MKTKVCSKCGKLKELSEFSNGLSYWCKNCRLEYDKKYRVDNREKRRKYDQEWRKRNPDKVKESGRKSSRKWSEKNPEYRKKYRKNHLEEERNNKREYRKNNKEKIRKYKERWMKNNPKKSRQYNRKYGKSKKAKKHRSEYDKKRRQSDSKYRLSKNMSTAVSISLKGSKANRHWEDLVGYTLEKLRQRLEINFDKNMNWENYGSYWWIDHTKPRSLFNFKTAEDKEFKNCWCLANLQPLWAEDNVRKGDKF